MAGLIACTQITDSSHHSYFEDVSLKREIDPVAAVAIIISIWIAITLQRVNKSLTRQTNFRTILSGHVTEIIAAIHKIHSLIPASGLAMDLTAQNQLGIASDDI